MPASIEVKGKSVDEAVFNGLQQLGLGIDEVDIEILEEGGRRFLGIGKSALVRLTEREMPKIEPYVPESFDDDFELEEEGKPARPEREPLQQRRQPKQQDRRKKERQPRPQKERSEPAKRQEAEKRPEPVEQPEAESVEVKVLENVDIPAAQQALDFLNGMFQVMKVSAVVNALEGTDPENLRLRITGEDTSVLIGRRGDTLDALQYLTGLIVNKDSEAYIRVMLDAEDYRKKREETLQKLARRLASNVIRSGRPAVLEPMNPYERRIMHAALQSNPKVETHSEGVDPNRRVVISRKGRPPRHNKRRDNRNDER